MHSTHPDKGIAVLAVRFWRSKCMYIGLTVLAAVSFEPNTLRKCMITAEF
jgi:hypothetical protein